MIEPPEVQQVGLIYRVIWEDLGLKIEAARVKETHDVIHAEVTVGRRAGTGWVLVDEDRLNLWASRSINSFADGCAEIMTPLPTKEEWRKILRLFARQVRQLFRTPEASAALGKETPRASRVEWLVDPFVEVGGPTCLFGPGGSGKSTLASAIALTAASGISFMGELVGPGCPVLYLDWEDRYSSQNWLYHALLNGKDVPIHPPVRHLRVRTRLVNALEHVVQEVADHQIGLVLIDSMMLARGMDATESGPTIQFFEALEVLDCATLIVDHMSKAQMGPPSTGRQHPYGSIVTENTARHTWSVQAQDAMDAGRLRVLLTHEKANKSAAGEQRGVEIVYDTATEDRPSVTFRTLASTEMGGFEAALDPAKRITMHLADGPSTTEEIAEALQLPAAAAKATLTQMVAQRSLVKLSGGRFGLAAREEAHAAVPGR